MLFVHAGEHGYDVRREDSPGGGGDPHGLDQRAPIALSHVQLLREDHASQALRSEVVQVRWEYPASSYRQAENIEITAVFTVKK